MRYQEAVAAWRADEGRLAALGFGHAADCPRPVAYLPDEFKRDYTLAMDALPATVTAPNSGTPWMFTAFVDPEQTRVLFQPTKAADILGEVRKGTWLDKTAIFQVVEHTGEVSSYDDYSENGNVGLNSNWPQRQAYLFQTIIEYGDYEVEAYGLSRLNYVAELDKAAADVSNRFLNLSYLFGVAGLQCYGVTNDPNLPPSITPTAKAYGHASWYYQGALQATPNEIQNDFIALFGQLLNQTGQQIDEDTEMELVMPNGLLPALNVQNQYGVSAAKMLKDQYPKLDITTVPQYGVQTAANPNGMAGGNLIQLIAKKLDGQDTGFCAFNEKLRQHQPTRGTSSWKKKVTSGTWGAINKMPFCIASMVGA